MKAKEAHIFYKTVKQIFWLECPVCNSFDAYIEKPNETCSEICQSKLDHARYLIVKNKWASNGDTIIYKNVRMVILQSNCRDINIVSKLDKLNNDESKLSFSYVLILKGSNGADYVSLRDVILFKEGFVIGEAK